MNSKILNPVHTAQCQLHDLGLIDYGEAYALQKAYAEDVLKGGTQHLLFCEHPDVFTLGRTAKESNIIDLEEIKRREILTVVSHANTRLDFHPCRSTVRE